MNALFNGQLYFVRIQFIIKNKNDQVISISNSDMAIMINYATQAAFPIMQYASQYGSNNIVINKGIIQYNVQLQNLSFDDAQLKTWISDIIKTHNLPANSCIVILKHDSIANSSWAPGTGGEHYEDLNPYTYILSSVAGTFDANGDLWRDGVKLAVRDTNWQFAGNLSHEIAEMTVDPFGANPEVCDPCGPNCVSTYLNYFDASGNYIQTTQNPPYVVTSKKLFDFSFYINGIVIPQYAGNCPAPPQGCSYAPPLLWMNLYGSNLKQFVCANNLDGRLEVFAIGGDKAVYHIWQTVPNGNWFEWSSWDSLGGIDIQQIVIGKNADGRLDLFALGGDHAVYHIWQTIPNGNWSQWAGLAGHNIQQIIVGYNADRRLELFALGGDHTVYHIWQIVPNGNWSPWAGLAGHDIQQIIVGNNADGRLEIFALGGDHMVYHIWQTVANGNWSPWARLAGHDIQNIIVGNNADGRLELFAIGKSQAMYHIWQIEPNSGWN